MKFRTYTDNNVKTALIS